MSGLTLGRESAIMGDESLGMKLARLNERPEVFYSLQGEGPSAGSPAMFIRLAGCNLRCVWCDTKHAQTGGIECTPQEVADILARQPGWDRLVVTGGEPLVQTRELEELFFLLPERVKIEVETNGTIAPAPALIERVTEWNVSPKLPHAGNARKMPMLEAFRPLPNVWYKFVVRGEEDWAEVEKLQLPRTQIMLMPCAANREKYRSLLPEIAQMCIRHVVRLSPRLHVELWDMKPGC